MTCTRLLAKYLVNPASANPGRLTVGSLITRFIPSAPASRLSCKGAWLVAKNRSTVTTSRRMMFSIELLQVELRPEVNLPRFGVVDQKLGRTFAHHFPMMNQIGAVDQFQHLADVM